MPDVSVQIPQSDILILHRNYPFLPMFSILICNLAGNVPRPAIERRARGHNMNDITMPGSPALWAERLQI